MCVWVGACNGSLCHVASPMYAIDFDLRIPQVEGGGGRLTSSSILPVGLSPLFEITVGQSHAQ